MLHLLEWSRLATEPMGTIAPRFGSACHFLGAAVLLGDMIASHPAGLGPPVRVASAALGMGRAFGLPARWSQPVLGRCGSGSQVADHRLRVAGGGQGSAACCAGSALAAMEAAPVVERHVRTSLRMRWLAFMAMAFAPSLFLDVWAPVVRMIPLWPISWTTSLDVVAADPVIRIELLRSLYRLAPASLLLIISPLLRFRMQRLWWVGLALSACLIWWKWPDLNPLVVPAYPTTYFRSPTGFAAASITRGEGLYRDHCTGCHGRDGRGDGSAAGVLPRPPADLTARHLWMHPDGELFWWISHGIDGQDGIKLMPGFDVSLGEDGVWNVIDYIRARNGGFVRAAQGHWSPTLLAPDFPVSCAGGHDESLSEFRSMPVRLVIGKALTANPGITTVTVADPPPITASAMTSA